MIAQSQSHTQTQISRAQQGDTAAFEQLYRTHVGRIYALCLRLEGNPQQAEEKTQDVFVRAWEKLESFRGESAFSTWLHQLAVNVVLGGWRTEQRRRQRIVNTDNAILEKQAEKQLLLDEGIDFERALALLPPNARKVFVLHQIEGYKHEEIAACMGLSPGTCKAQLHRARQLLRKAFER